MWRVLGQLFALTWIVGCGLTLPPSADLEQLIEVQVPEADPELPTASELLARHIEVTGMRRALEGSSSVLIRGSAEAVELGVLGEFEAMRARPAQTLLRLDLPSVGAVVYGGDSERGWMIHPLAGVEIFEGAARVKARRSAVYDHLLLRPEGLETYLTVGRRRFQGRDCYEVFGLFPDDEGLGLSVRERSFREYFEVDTGFLAGVEETSGSSAGMVSVTSVFDDYAELGGSLVATRSVQRSPGLELILTVDSVEYDVVPEEAFALPKQVSERLRP